MDKNKAVLLQEGTVGSTPVTIDDHHGHHKKINQYTHTPTPTHKCEYTTCVCVCGVLGHEAIQEYWKP